MLIARRHHVGIEFAGARFGQQTIGDALARRPITVELHAVALVEVDTQLFQVIGADVAVQNRFALRLGTGDQPFLSLIGGQL